MKKYAATVPNAASVLKNQRPPAMSRNEAVRMHVATDDQVLTPTTLIDINFLRNFYHIPDDLGESGYQSFH